MRGFVPRPLPAIAWAHGGLRLLLLLGCALALGACSKCDIPDLGHWGGPHACHDGPAQQQAAAAITRAEDFALP